MQQAVLEAHAVDERLQGRAGRAQRLRHVDLAGAARIEIIGRGDARAHLARRIVDREDGNGNFRSKRASPLARQLLQRLLQSGVDGELVQARVGLGADHLIGRVRRQHRQLHPRGRHRLVFGARDFVVRHGAGGIGAIEHAVARGARGFRVAIRPPPFRRLRQRDQERGFAERQTLGLLAEIRQRGGADAFQVAAVRRQRQIERQDIVFAQQTFQLDRARRLPQLGQRRCDAGAAPSRRATCMVSVEPPDTMRPLRTNCTPARASAIGSMP